MAYQTYTVPWLAEFYHSFPHRDFNFLETTSVFSPDDDSYQQSLIMWGILPAAIGTLSFILFTGFYLCCSLYHLSSCSAPPPKGRPFLKKCLRYYMFLTGQICCGAVIMGFTANDMTSKGVNEFAADIQNVKSSIQSIRDQITGIDKDVETAEGDLTHLLDYPIVHELVFVVEQIKEELRNLKSPLASIDNKMSVGTSALSKLVDDILMYNHYRWWSTWGLFCLNAIICVTLIYAAVKKSKCGFILMTLFSLFAILLNWAFVGIELSGSVGAGDLCYNPKAALDEITSNKVQQEVLHYYVECEYSSDQNPLSKELTDADLALNRSMKMLNTDIVTHIFPKEPANIVKSVTEKLKNADSRLGTINNILLCEHLHKEYIDVLDAVCNDILNGLSLLLLAGLILSFFLGLLLCLVLPIWKYVPRLGPILRKNVYLTTSSYEGPPGEDKHDDTPYHSAVEESIDEGKSETYPLVKKGVERPPAYESAGQANADLQFFSLEEDRKGRGKNKSGRSRGGE